MVNTELLPYFSEKLLSRFLLEVFTLTLRQVRREFSFSRVNTAYFILFSVYLTDDDNLIIVGSKVQTIESQQVVLNLRACYIYMKRINSTSYEENCCGSL